MEKSRQLEHILLHPAVYIGSSGSICRRMWVWDGLKQCFTREKTTTVPGFLKTFDEILVNAVDNKQRNPEMDFIKINVDVEKNLISVMSNGRGIPIEMHKEEKMYVPTMMFGHLLTSSNYDDTQKKVKGGRSGYGAKLCNIYSTEFTLETVCDNKHFKQTWKSNMTETKEPTIKSTDHSDFTSITYYPDFAKFEMEKLDKDTVALLSKRAYDIAGCVRGVAVHLNGNELPIKSFEDYVQLFLKDGSNVKRGKKSEEGKGEIAHEVVNDRWEVAVTVSHKGFQQVSFVNNIATTKGGTHVDHVVEQVIERLNAVIKPKFGEMKPSQIKQHLWVFINCQIDNPKFDSPTKDYMISRFKDFGSKCSLGEEFFKSVINCVMPNIFQAQPQATKNGNSFNIKGIKKLSDARYAGTGQGFGATLILTEGDSAKSVVVSGLSVVGHDRYGVFPLCGKLLNVREASQKQRQNPEINNIVKIMGLTYGKKYRNVEDMKTLRYGRMMIMTDQDEDGFHIKGLLISFIHYNWPDLLKLPFLEAFITPIVKVSKGKEEIAFYSIPEFREWKLNTANVNTWKVKYYKGLGMTTPKEMKEYFADMDKHRIRFDYSGNADDEAICLAFSKEQKDARKRWIQEKKAGAESYLYGPGTKSISYSDFVNKELVLFYIADIERSIPSLIDGLKPSQRKVLFTCFKRNNKSEVKVFQLSGSVAELSAYHHGEENLSMTIVKLAQNYIGSNNLNLLMPIGGFGTRIHGGKDIASSRYNATELSPLTRLVFPAHDDNVLNYLFEENQMIEPEWYCPIIPMVLVNGADGIATGYSTKIPNFDVRDLAQYVKALLLDQEPTPIHPSYKNFTGEIRQNGHQEYESQGRLEVLGEKNLRILELPIGLTTEGYRTFLGDLKCIASFEDHHTDVSVDFEVRLKGGIKNMDLLKTFNLTSNIHLGNMVLCDAYGAIKKYETVDEIIREYYVTRLELYVKRKEFLEGMLTAESERLTAQARFTLELENEKRRNLVTNLVKRGYPSDPLKTWKESHKSATLPDFGYLLDLHPDVMEKELLKQRDDKRSELEILRSKTPTDLWLNDLDVFLEQLEIVEAESGDVCKDAGISSSKRKRPPKSKKARKRKRRRRAKKDAKVDMSDMSEDDL